MQTPNCHPLCEALEWGQFALIVVLYSAFAALLIVKAFDLFVYSKRKRKTHA
jgi:hypothetical protein